MQIVDLLEDILNHHSATVASRSSALTSLAKVSYRLSNVLGEEGDARVDSMLEGFRSSITLELQQRSEEGYVTSRTHEWDQNRREQNKCIPEFKCPSEQNNSACAVFCGFVSSARGARASFLSNPPTVGVRRTVACFHAQKSGAREIDALFFLWHVGKTAEKIVEILL